MTSEKLSRREFLKLSSIFSIASQLRSNSILSRFVNFGSNKANPNFLIVVFDALAGKNMSLYGYERETTPMLEKLADKATVFHNHYSTANFTTPGTASLLTGTYPWTHRGYNLGGTVVDKFVPNNIFRIFSELGYHTTAFSHNPFASWLLNQFSDYINQKIDEKNFYLVDLGSIPNILDEDERLASQANYLWTVKDGPASKLNLFPRIIDAIFSIKKDSLPSSIINDYPRGIPSTYDHRIFLLEDAIDELYEHINSIKQPFLGYFHFFPPHKSYNTRREFIDSFLHSKNWAKKPNHYFSENLSTELLNYDRRLYDEYVLYVDSEIHRLINLMESGLLENTYLILTSDHGEMFERGISGHSTEVLYEPLIHIPLIIFQPGQTERKDIYKNTSSVDILPTFLHLLNQKIPSWCEGQVLPGINHENKNSRSVFAMEAKSNSKFERLTKSTFVIIRENFKLIYYTGYQDYDNVVELYDIYTDPEELRDISLENTTLVEELLSEIEENLSKQETIK